MKGGDCDPLPLATAANTLAVAVARDTDDDQMALLTAVPARRTGSLTTVAVEQSPCKKDAKAQQGS